MLPLGSFFHFTQRIYRKCWTKTLQMDPACQSVIATLKFSLILPKMLDEMFDGDQTSSNIIQHNCFLLFIIFVNFRHVKCVQYFIQHTKFAMLDETLDAFEPAFTNPPAERFLKNRKTVRAGGIFLIFFVNFSTKYT